MTHWKSRDSINHLRWSRSAVQRTQRSTLSTLAVMDASSIGRMAAEQSWSCQRIKRCGSEVVAFRQHTLRSTEETGTSWGKWERWSQNLRNILLFELQPPTVSHISFPNSYPSGGRCDALLAELDDASLWEVKSPRWYSSPLRSLQGFSQWFGRTRKRSSCGHRDMDVTLEWLNRLSNGFRYRRRLTQWWPHWRKSRQMKWRKRTRWVLFAFAFESPCMAFRSAHGFLAHYFEDSQLFNSMIHQPSIIKRLEGTVYKDFVDANWFDATPAVFFCRHGTVSSGTVCRLSELCLWMLIATCCVIYHKHS